MCMFQSFRTLPFARVSPTLSLSLIHTKHICTKNKKHSFLCSFVKQKNLAEGVKHSKERRIVREMNEQCKESTKEEGVAGGGGWGVEQPSV